MTAYKTVNVAYQLGGNAELITDAAEGTDVLGLVECRTFDNEAIDVTAILGDGWDVRQDLTDAATAGSVLAVRKSRQVKVIRSKLKRMSRASSRGGGVQDRHLRISLIRDHGKRVKVLVCHLPLDSTGRQEVALEVVRRAIHRIRALRRFVRWVLLGDVNMELKMFAVAIDAPHHYGVKPMIVAWSKGWPPTETAKERRQGSDHWILTLWARWWGPR